MRVRISLSGDQSIPAGQESEHLFDERGGVIGRSDDCAWVLQCENKLVSRRHAVITFEDGAFFLYDGSVNGVFHNDAVEPIGPGGRVRLSDGDRLRLGEYRLAVELLEADQPPPRQVASAPPAEPSPAPAPAATVVPIAEARPAPTAPTPDPVPAGPPPAVRTLGLGETRDVFEPPAALIPEDWDLQLDAEEAAGESPSTSIARQLNALEPASARALLDGLRLDVAMAEDVELTPEAINALGRSLRIALQGLWSLQAELDAVERRLSGGRIGAGAPECPEPREFARALVTADELERDRLVFQLHDLAAQLEGRHEQVVGCFSSSVRTVVEQFAPAKVEGRFRQQLTRRGPLMRAWLRLRRLLTPRAAYWNCYRDWYRQQRGEDYRPVLRLLEKKFLALYASRSKEQVKPRASMADAR